jgi:hypothetical protein
MGIGQNLFKCAIGARSGLKLNHDEMPVRIARGDVNLASRHNTFTASVSRDEAWLNPVKLSPD